jgi:hypothetical protein
VHPAQRPRRDRRRIEDDDICGHPLGDQPPIVETEHCGPLAQFTCKLLTVDRLAS